MRRPAIMRKFGAASLFLMSILLASVITPATNGFQMIGFVPANTYVDFAFAQEETVDDAEDETVDDAEDETVDDAEDMIEDDAVDDIDETEDDSETDNVGQEVSEFVQNAREQFMAQKEETRAIIDACRDAVRNAAPEERADIRVQCREDLNEVRESYQQLRRTYHDVFKEFREHVRVLVMGDQGLSDTDIAAAVDAINMRAQREDLKDRAHELRMQMRE
jgi:hypothetical protein